MFGYCDESHDSELTSKGLTRKKISRKMNTVRYNQPDTVQPIRFEIPEVSLVDKNKFISGRNIQHADHSA
jgi:hypothetical protein